MENVGVHFPSAIIYSTCKDFQFENYYDYLKIEGSYDNGSNWEPANNYWMKNNRNYYNSYTNKEI